MKVRIALVQCSLTKDAKSNLAKSVKLVEQAAKAGAKIVCLQELFSSPYFPQTARHEDFSYAENIPGPTSRAMERLARRQKIYLIVPLFEKRTTGVYYNSALVFGPKGLLGHYRKLHVPQDAHSFSEKYFFANGDLGYLVVPTTYGKIGVLICWDQWFPEAARILALKGAEILFYPTAIGWHKSEHQEVARDQREAWLTMHRAHAIANGCFVAAPNRAGVEGDLTFWGSSCVYAPSGRLIATAGISQEGVLLADCDLDQIRQQRLSWPFLRDRRIDTYDPILKRSLE